jgi:hypothetical protein
VHQHHSNDPVHLGLPGLIPGDSTGPRIECASCFEAFPQLADLQLFGGRYRCDPCIRAGACKTCRSAMALKGADSCASCDIAFYVANPDEFLDAVAHGLCRTEEGAAIARAVLIPRGATVAEIAAMSTTAARRGQADIAEVLFRAAANARRVAA